VWRGCAVCEGSTVLIEGECWEYSTINHATQEMHKLGFPTIGLPKLCNFSISVSVSESVSAVDYRSPVAEYGIIWRTLLCTDDVMDLDSYESAVLGE
jgi:hypothetical protein